MPAMKQLWTCAPWVLACALTGCGPSGGQGGPSSGHDLAGSDNNGKGHEDGGITGDDSGVYIPGDMTPVGPLVIAPLDQMLTMSVGGVPPKLQFTATLDGQSVAPQWTVDRGEVGAIDVGNGQFTPAGTIGGRATVTATFGTRTATTTVTVALSQAQNGDPDFPGPTPGASGPGGVGGNGPGGVATDPQKTVLDGTPTADSAVHMLYPYDGTVWPRGLLAPLLQWDPGATRKFDAVKVTLHSKSFDYTGTFKANKTPFVNLPLPQAVWHAVTYSNGGSGDDLTVKLVFEDTSTATPLAIGPYTMTWHIAPASLKGTVYYNSYGTHLVANSGETSCGGVAGECCSSTACVNKVVRKGPAFGAATLAIKPGVVSGSVVPDPVIVVGSASTDNSGCSACHTVSTNGQTLLTQKASGNSYATSGRYDLTTKTAGSVAGTNHTFPALSPDGTWFLSNSGGMTTTDTTSRAFNIDGTLMAPQPGNLPATLHACMPTFSPDGTWLAYDNWTGTGTLTDGKTLMVMKYDPANKNFATAKSLYAATTGTVSWSSFLPTNDAIVFEHELVSGDQYGYTRLTGKGELMWVDTATGNSRALDQANGTGYLPTFGTNHTGANDAKLNFEPTVNPVASGGYAWIVFTSRRSYGNVAAIDAYASDPREYDWQKNATTKKLWVAAIDLNAPPGTDPSHPAFYLPAQELYAGNARGFWAVDPCQMDGKSCETGDECCGGYCRPGSGSSGLICTDQQPMCAQEFEKCTTDADCCGNQGGGITCINGFCSKKSPIS
jgi:WD40 repeat protein